MAGEVLAKNYRGITHTSIAVKISNALPRNRIEPKIEKIHRKNKNVFRSDQSSTSQLFTIRRILVVGAKKPRGNNIICRLLQGLTQREDGANTSRVRPTERNCHNDAI